MILSIAAIDARLGRELAPTVITAKSSTCGRRGASRCVVTSVSRNGEISTRPSVRSFQFRVIHLALGAGRFMYRAVFDVDFVCNRCNV